MVSTGLLGVIVLSPLWAAVAASVAIRRHGRSLIDWAPIVLRFAQRRRTGQTLWLARPVTRPRQDGILHLPGTAASLRVVTPGDSANGAAAVHDPHRQTLTAVATRLQPRLRAPRPGEPRTRPRSRLGPGSGSASPAPGTSPPCRSWSAPSPTAATPCARHWSQQGHPARPRWPVSDLQRAGRLPLGLAAAPHEAYLAISLDLKAAQAPHQPGRRRPARVPSPS
ncbi:SCO6880 family protein [Streptomyces sp. MS1.AVA.3]|uniref:SCO6880 family protein n=1 Tax=Streptomyces decoyicus TaxID=249567 RepID=UPI0030C30B35